MNSKQRRTCKRNATKAYMSHKEMMLKKRSHCTHCEMPLRLEWFPNCTDGNIALCPQCYDLVFAQNRHV